MNTKGTWKVWAAAGVVLLGVGFLAMQGTSGQMAKANVMWELEPSDRDLHSIRTDTLRVLVLRDPLTWEERTKAVSGLEWELLKRYAQQEKIPIKAVPMAHADSLLLALQLGQGDIVAAQLTPRRDRKEWIAFTSPYRMVVPVLATLRPDHITYRGRKDQHTDSVAISAWSPFADPHYRFDHGADPRNVLSDPYLTPEELLMEVVLGRLGGAVISDARASYEAGRFPVLDISGPIGPPRPLCFGVRRNSVELLASLDQWLESEDETEARKHFIKAYTSRIPRSGALVGHKGIAFEGDSISPFDHHFQAHADAIAWEWELLAAMAYKESRFDSAVVSYAGAQGLMQIMPQTAAGLGLSPTDAVGEHVRAAAKYLARLDMMWKRQVPDRDQRLRFVLASYNAGPGHIIDAQRLAERMGLDPQRWEHNVERAVLLKAKPRYFMMPGLKNGYCIGSQVFHYVRDIVSIYDQLVSRPRSESNELMSAIPDSARE